MDFPISTDYSLADATLCVAPMMAYTDRHCRYLHRLLAPRALLFTEMVTSNALRHGPSARLLDHDPAERPVVFQVGGSDPVELAQVASTIADAGFSEINLNVGCPSDRVRQGAFGASLMLDPDLVADCVAAMQAAVNIPITVKCRLGVDDQDSYPALLNFCERVVSAGAARLYVHARKAILGKLSPAQNRQIPPLIYSRVYDLAEQLSQVPIVINGGITERHSAHEHLRHTAGVMLGRAAFHNPALLKQLHEDLFPIPRKKPAADSVALSLSELATVFTDYQAYAQRQLQAGVGLTQLVKPVLGLFAGRPGARKYRRMLSDSKRLKVANHQVFADAFAAVNQMAA